MEGEASQDHVVIAALTPLQSHRVTHNPLSPLLMSVMFPDDDRLEDREQLAQPPRRAVLAKSPSPRSATPRHSTPLYATPRHSTLLHATPLT